jgi:MYXO-CTERM domain-containing protein
MLRAAVGAAILLWSGSVSAHPSLYFDDSGEDEIRTRAADTRDTGHGWSFADVYAANRAAADAVLSTRFSYTVDIPDRDGSGAVAWSYTLSSSIPPPHPNNPDYPPWTQVTRGLAARMEVMTIAWIVTGDARYLSNADKSGAVDTALLVAAWSTWTDPGYACSSSCLDTAHLTLGVALVYDVAYPMLSDGERAALRGAIADKGLARLAVDVAALDAAATEDSVPSNLHALRTAALAVGAAAIADEVDTTARLDLARRATRHFFDLQGADGGSFEGHVYGSYAASYLVNGAYALARRGGEDLLGHPWLAQLPRFAAAFLASDLRTTANFGDSSIGAIYWVGPMFALAARGDAAAQWYLELTGTTRPAGLLLPIWARTDLTAEPLAGSGSAWFPDIGHAALRAGFGGAPVVAVKSGPPRVSVGHNHYDQNSLIVNAYGEWIAADPGYRSYFNPAQRLYTTGTVGHNTIMVDKSVSADGTSATGGQSALTGGALSYFFDGAGYAKIVGNAPAAYPAGLIDRFGRRVFYAKPDVVWVFDDLAAPAAHAWSSLFHTVPGGTFAAGDGPAELVATGFRARLQIASVATAPWAAAYPRATAHPGAGAYGPYGEWRTERTNAVRIATALIPGPHVHGDLANPGFEDALASWTPRRTDGSHAADPDVHHGGAASARIRFAAADSGYFYGEPLTVAPGGMAAASAWVKTAPGTTGTITLRLHWMRAGAYLDTPAAPVELGPVSDWTRLELPPAVAPPGADALRVDLGFAGAGTAWFDDAVAEVDNLADQRPARVVPLGSPAIGMAIDGEFGIEAAASRVGAADETSLFTVAPTAPVDHLPDISTDAALFAVGLDPSGQLRRAFLQGGSQLAIGDRDLIRADGAASFDLAVESGEGGCVRLTLTEVETLGRPPYRVRAVPDAVYIGSERVPYVVEGGQVRFPAGDDLGPDCEPQGGADAGPDAEPDTSGSGGCGCRTGGSGSIALVLVALIALRRRRRLRASC